MPKTRRLSDATLVRRSQQGDRRAFAALLARYDWRLRGLAHALLLDGDEMDTALGIGYLRAWRDVVRINAKDDVAGWLYRVTYNACIDRLRHLESAGERASALAHDGIAAGLATLPAAERVPVVLVDREGFTPAAAARILGLSPTVLESTLASARERLAPHVPDPPPAPDTDVVPTAGPDALPAPSSEEMAPGDDHGDPGDDSPPEDEVGATAGADAPDTNADVDGTGDGDGDGDGEEQSEAETAAASHQPGVAVPGDPPGNGSGNGSGNGQGSDHIARAIADLPDEDTIVDDPSAVVVPNSNGKDGRPNRGRGRRARRRAQHTAAQASESVDQTGEHDR